MATNTEQQATDINNNQFSVINLNTVSNADNTNTTQTNGNFFFFLMIKLHKSIIT